MVRHPTNKPRRRLVSLLCIGIPVVAVVIAFGCVVGQPHLRYWNYEPREGDIIFQSLPDGALTRMIEGATNSPWSHCGIIANEDGQWVVYEAYGAVQRVTLHEFHSRGRGFRFAVVAN